MPRNGVLMVKEGCVSVFDSAGVHRAVTVLRIIDGKVVTVSDVNASSGLMMFSVPRKKIKKPQRHMAGGGVKSGVIVNSGGCFANCGVGDRPDLCAHFGSMSHVDVTAYSKGKGFAGVMKRHNFAGLRASHGVSAAHRSPGSAGQCQDPGKVRKGKAMPGRLGCELTTVQSLSVHAVMRDIGVILVIGAVPGGAGAHVFVRKAIRR